MANLDSTIVIKTAEYRPCFVNGRRALFHRWVDNARPAVPRGMRLEECDRPQQLWTVQAIVEFEDGQVARVWPSEIEFLPAKEFAEYSWERPPMDESTLPFTLAPQEDSNGSTERI